ncbi:MAG: LCP family protein [Lachnospiraceae bacterium]|nr:LCP family protein [Lachnospiraceae bacterium]MCI9471349.1 LCP family protein [Lachnospiraceae bacterium]
MARKGTKKRVILFIVELLILLLLIGGLFVYGQINSRLNQIEGEELDNVEMNVVTSEKMTGYQNIALFGVDSRGDGSDMGVNNSDTIIIASINNDTKAVKLVSVYRDTLLNVGNDSYHKANSAYMAGGASQAVSMLNTNLDLQIQDYVTVDMNALVKVIDLLGGLTIEMTADEVVHMNNYCVETSEITGQDYTRIEPEVAGVYELNGVQATSYARIRYTAGLDFERTERQRLILQKLVQKAKKSSLGTLSSIMDEVFPLVKTSLSKSQIFDMGAGMLSYTFDETCGFPYEHTGKMIDGKGDVVIPDTLETNVKELHRFLFGDEAYVPSDVVIHRSQKIAELGGIDPAKGHTEETSTVTETETDTPDNTTTDTEYPTETQEYSEDPQTYSQDYTDTGYTETYYTDSQPYSDENYQDTYQDDGMYQDNGQAPADNVDGTGDQTWTEGGQ